MTKLALFALLAAGCRGDAQADPPTTDLPKTGHYCNLGVFTRDEATRHRALVASLTDATLGHDELPDGYAIRIAGAFKETGEWLDGVHRCCPTVAYHLELPSHAGVVTLRITGGDGAKEFIREEFAKLLEAQR